MLSVGLGLEYVPVPHLHSPFLPDASMHVNTMTVFGSCAAGTRELGNQYSFRMQWEGCVVLPSQPPDFLVILPKVSETLYVSQRIGKQFIPPSSAFVLLLISVENLGHVKRLMNIQVCDFKPDVVHLLTAVHWQQPLN